MFFAEGLDTVETIANFRYACLPAETFAFAHLARLLPGPVIAPSKVGGFLRHISIFISLCAFLSPAALQAAECRQWEVALHQLQSSPDADQRSAAGRCLLRVHLEQAEVVRETLRIIKDKREDLFLREDLIEAFAEAPLRKTIKMQQTMAPKINEQDRQALGRTLASAQSLLDVTQAVTSMQETVVVTRLESDFFRALSDIALDDSNHVVLRNIAVEAMEKSTKKVVDSGVYEDRTVRLAQETLKTVASRDDSGSYYSGAGPAYERLASAGLPHFVAPVAMPAGGRMLSSERPRPVR